MPLRAGRRGAHDKPDLVTKRLCLVRGVDATAVREKLDWAPQPAHLGAQVVLDGLHHQVADVLAAKGWGAATCRSYHGRNSRTQR